jgi:hypothetical protein
MKMQRRRPHAGAPKHPQILTPRCPAPLPRCPLFRFGGDGTLPAAGGRRGLSGSNLGNQRPTRPSECHRSPQPTYLPVKMSQPNAWDEMQRGRRSISTSSRVCCPAAPPPRFPAYFSNPSGTPLGYCSRIAAWICWMRFSGLGWVLKNSGGRFPCELSSRIFISSIIDLGS